jgi:D-alanine-D-alanine ligase
VRTKLLRAGNGLPTPNHMVIESQPLPAAADITLRYPLIVKPALEDASGGIENDSVVQTYEALVERVRHILEHFEQPALVEEYIDGREIHAAILGNENPEVLPLFEMEFDDSYFHEEDDDSFRPHIISYSAKWDPTTEVFYSMEATCPAQIEPALAARIREVALAAFRVTECRDYARVDMRIGPDGEPYILEVNPNPDLALDGAFEMCARASGRSYAQTLAAIAEQALARTVVEEESEPVVTDQMLVRHGRPSQAERSDQRATNSDRDAA